MPFSFIPKMFRVAFVLAIRAYQRTLSPDTGVFRFWYPYGCCRFQPTCSQYAIEAITRFGVVRGTLLALRRVGRCHPWHACDYDPIPKVRP